MNRRHLVLAGLSLGALGVTEVLRPRRRVKLLQSGTIETAMPAEFQVVDASIQVHSMISFDSI